MGVSRRRFVSGAGIAAAAILAACGNQEETTAVGGDEQTAKAVSTLSLNMAAWRYNAGDDVYYQTGIPYCEKPANADYENLAILVPGAFFEAADNGDGTFTCKKSESGTVGGYTVATAPIVMPVNTPGYSAQSPMADYQSAADYTGSGFVYVLAGCRGRDDGAPAGVTDLKAAVRFLRHVTADVPGSTDRIFTFGMSGGGAQSALMGASGDAPEYAPYLTAIGAVSDTSDAVCGSMDWCPITGLDVGDASYEWMMSCTRTGLSDEERGISDGLAEAYAAWVNAAGIADDEGSQLRLEESTEGIYQAGSYYEAVRKTIEESLNGFLAGTEFPYEASSGGSMGGPNGGAPLRKIEPTEDGGLPEDAIPEGNVGATTSNGETPGVDMRSKGPMPEPDTAVPNGGEAIGNENATADEASAALSEELDDISRAQTSGGVSLSGTYETVVDYVAALNVDGEWVIYDEATNTATITSVADFCVALKRASKALGAFDQLDRGQGENTLFGVDGNPLHFDAIMADVLEKQGSSYALDYRDDLVKTDANGSDARVRVNMYTPLHYLLGSEAGYGTSTPAEHWRIRSGINQGDTALTTELNLALALKAYAGVKSVDFATVWGQGHTQAEHTGSATENFVSWVKDCLA